MGTQVEHDCRACGAHFEITQGGGFFFDQLHCDRCGAVHDVAHEDMGDIHLAYIKGLDGPYAVARADFDAHIRQTYPGEPLTESQYQAAVEETVEPCPCGGVFRYDAPPRCPGCRATSEHWTEGDVMVHYD